MADILLLSCIGSHACASHPSLYSPTFSRLDGSLHTEAGSDLKGRALFMRLLMRDHQ